MTRALHAFDLRVGDRVVVTHTEFEDWRPTGATVIGTGLKFPDSLEYRRRTIKVRLDEHPFPEVLIAPPMRDFSWEEGNNKIKVEAETGPAEVSQ